MSSRPCLALGLPRVLRRRGRDGGGENETEDEDEVMDIMSRGLGCSSPPEGGGSDGGREDD
jgi:hypothetical protein